jgi:peptidoglycan hydrolase-like protein with peptidoglycan-binding domain
MILRLHDNGDNVKRLQRNLNKLGSALLVDGDFGPGTRDAVVSARTTLAVAAVGPPSVAGPDEADDLLLNALENLPEPFPPLGAPGVTFIARLEIGSPRQYQQMYRHPEWPGETSGITIGIGYDLKFVTRAEFEADWAGLTAAAVNRLMPAFRTTGSDALRTSLADLDFPLEVAMKVFTDRTLPQFLARTRSIYPQIDNLPRARKAALVSLVYNRGTDLDGDRRREMRAIRDRLNAGDFDGVATEIDAMDRLWPPQSGLVKRRHDEARLWRSGFGALQLE